MGNFNITPQMPINDGELLLAASALLQHDMMIKCGYGENTPSIWPWSEQTFPKNLTGPEKIELAKSLITKHQSNESNKCPNFNVLVQNKTF